MSPPDEPDRLRVAALVAAVVSAASLPAWAAGLFVSVFLFGAPGSEHNRLLVALAWSIWTYGATAFAGGVAAFVCLWRKRYRAAVIAGGLPLPHALVVVALFVALQLVCGGQTRC